MAFSYVTKTGDGTTTSFTFSFEGQDDGYIRESDIVATVDGASAPFTLLSSNTLEFDTAPSEDSEILIRRVMPKEVPYADFQRGNNFGQEVLNNSFLQQLYVIHELLDGWFPDGFTIRESIKFIGNLIVNADLVVSGKITGFDSVRTDPFSAVNFQQADSLYLNVSGDTMEGDIDMDGNDILNAGLIQASDITVSGTGATGVLQRAEDQADYSEEWAQSPDPISVDAGGDGLTDHSSKFWAEEAEAAVQTFDSSTVLPSSQSFAVGSGVQSADLGNTELHPDAIRVFIDGVYQFTSTWTLTDGILEPSSGTWPGDGVTENMEVLVDATSSVSFNIPSNASVTEQKILDANVTTPKLADGSVTEPKLADDSVSPSKLTQASLDLFEGDIQMLSDTPFRKAGVKIVKGIERDAHYGFNNGILDAGGGKWVFVYRKAANHTVVNGSEIMAIDSYDKGVTFENERVIFTDPNYDTRNFVSRVMGNGRLGIIASRREEAPSLAYTDPVFIYSDDGGVTWSSQIVPSFSSGVGVNFHGNWIDYPASVGGDDDNGFIAYSYASVNGNVDALYTTDNGSTWNWVVDAATSASTITEVSCSRVGTQDKWIMIARPAGAIGDSGRVWTSADPLDFGSDVSMNIELAGNPPLTLYDEGTGLFWYFTFARRDRGWKTSINGYGLENVMLAVAEDGDTLYANAGDVTTTGKDWGIVQYLPDWASGYMHAYFLDGDWYATFVCGEAYPDHDYSHLCLIGDFLPSGYDQANFNHLYVWNHLSQQGIFRDSIKVGFFDQVPDQIAAGTFNVASGKPGLLTQAFTNNTRTHHSIRNNNGLVGSITSNNNTVSFNNLSDARFKEEEAPLGSEVDTGLLIDSLEPVAFSWKTDGIRDHGFIAQDLHAVYPRAVQEGYGDLDDIDFTPWQVDSSKLIPTLVAEIQSLRKRVQELEDK